MEELLLAETIKDARGFFSNRELGRHFTDAQIKETLDLLGNVDRLPQHRHEFLLKEAMTTSDFPLLFGDVLGREMLAAYKGTPANWPKYTKVSTVKDFKDNYRFRMTDGDQVLTQVAEKGEYPASSRGTTKYTLAVKKYGRQYDISYEAIINDDLNALKDTPQRMALAADRTEQTIVIALYAGDLGTHGAANLYENGVNASNAALTIANLETALENQAALTDANTEPILNRAKYLVVPPSLEMTARQILTSTTKMWSEGAAGTPTPYPTTNVVSQMGLELVVEPYLPILNTTDPLTQWYLFSDPRELTVLEAARMSGHESPEICMKASDKVAVGGGTLMSPFSGDFATDNILYRVRLIFGGCKEDWRGTYAGGLVNAVAAL